MESNSTISNNGSGGGPGGRSSGGLAVVQATGASGGGGGGGGTRGELGGGGDGGDGGGGSSGGRDIIMTSAPSSRESSSSIGASNGSLTTTTATTPVCSTSASTNTLSASGSNNLTPAAANLTGSLLSDASNSSATATAPATSGFAHQQRFNPDPAASTPALSNPSSSSAASSSSPWPKTPSTSGSKSANSSASPSKSTPQVDPHNNGARAALTNEIRAEFFRLYEQSGFQVPGLSPQNILRHKDKDLHFEGHDGLRDFWKQTAASRREILQLAREGHIRVVRGPDFEVQPPASPALQVHISENSQHHLIHTDPPAPPSEPPPAQSRKRSHPMSSATSSDSGSISQSSSKRQQSFPASSEEWPPSVDWGAQRVGVNAVSRLVHTLQNALDDYASPPSAGSNTSVSSHGGQGKSRLEEERDAALVRVAVLERERDEALAARDQALKIAEESYRELRAVVDSRFRRIRELTDAGGAVRYD